VKSPEKLLDLYYKSVGRGACLNLNIPPDRRGQIHANDVAALKEFRRILEATFATNLTTGAKITASNTRGNDRRFGADQVLSGHSGRYWSTDDAKTSPELVINFRKPVTFNVISLREYLPLGQRIDAFALDRWQDGEWKAFAAGTSIGNRKLLRTERITSEKIRLRITKAAASPAISEFGVFAEP